MSTGGSITLLWGRGGSAEVDIAGTGSFDIVDPAGAASFPEAVSTDIEFVTTSDGDYTVTVTWLGRTIFSKTLRLQSGNAVVFNVEPSLEELLDALTPVTSTTTDLEDVAAAVNTAGKFAGKVLFNTTTGVLLVADGPAAGDTWSTAAGVATHTPV